MIEWVTVKGYDETFDDDLWAESRHQVFRKIQDHTHSAMLHFYSPTLPDLAVKFFMVTYKPSLNFERAFYGLFAHISRLGCIAISSSSANHAKSVEIIFSTHILRHGAIFEHWNHFMKNANK